MNRTWKLITAAGLAGSVGASLLMLAMAPVLDWQLSLLVITSGAGIGIGIAMYLGTIWYTGRKESTRNGKHRNR